MAADTDAALSSGLRLMDTAASTQASRTDAIFLAMVLLCGAVAIVVFALIVIFVIRYRRGRQVDRTPPPRRRPAARTRSSSRWCCCAAPSR